LLVVGLLRKDYQIGAGFPAANPHNVFDFDARLPVTILTNERFCDFLPNVFFRGVVTLGGPVDEVEDLALLDDDREF
jgi:hypothetical protein